MKKILVFFLTVSILSQALINVGILAYYHVNKTYITQKLCINKSNPSAHCNGHCYLSKQLKKAEEGERKQLNNILKEKDEVLPLQHKAIVSGNVTILMVISLPLPYHQPVDSRAATSLLKPPTV